MFFEDDVIWVIDTSSVINVKELVKKTGRKKVFDALAELCVQGRLVFPQEVLDELENGARRGMEDLPLKWARENKQFGYTLGPCSEQLHKVMNDPVAKLTPDPRQDKGADDADPHVLATALEVVSKGSQAVVVTQESKKSPPQVPLNVAAGSLNLPSINLYALLTKIGIWEDELLNP